MAVTPPAPSAVREARRSFLHRRRRALSAAALTVAALAALAMLLLAPNRVASLRLGEVALAWWALAGVALVGLVALSRGLREADADVEIPGTSPLAPLALAAVWGSPALWLGLPPLLLGDGIRGLWPAAVVTSGAVIAILLLRAPGARADGLVASPSAVARMRWPAARGCQTLLASMEALVGVLFVWAQFAAVRELGAVVDRPRAATIGAVVAVLAAALLPVLARMRLAALGGGLALAGVAVPLVLVALGTTIAWPGVWSAVASRPRIAFIEGTRWTLDGRPVRGPDAAGAMQFTDEQRVEFTDDGTVTIEPRDGGRFLRAVAAGQEMAFHPGDRLIVPDGLRLRFEAGRRVPDAPDSGPAWVEPPSRSVGWPGLVALGLTGVLGALGLPAGIAPHGVGALAPRRGGPMAAGLVMAGAALAVGWTLYAAWLTPEVYVAGVAGPEVYTLPAGVSALGGWGGALAWTALGALAVGGAASALAGLRGVSVGEETAPSLGRYLPALLVLSAGLLACLTSVGAWGALLLALGVAASTLAPAAVLACWSERATPRGITIGATVGLLAFLVVALAAVTGSLGDAGGWTAAVAAAPAALAVPAHLLVAGLLRSRQTSPPRLPVALDGLSAPPRAG